MTFRLDVRTLVEESRNPLLSKAPWWERIQLGSIAQVINGFAFPSSRFRPDRGIPLIRIRDIEAMSTETRYEGPFDEAYRVPHGALLVGMDGDFNVARWMGQEGLLNQRVCRVRVRDESLYNEQLLRWVLPGYLREVHEHTPSVTVKHLSSRTINELPLPLPPRAEQDRIVAAIEEEFSRIDAAVASLRRVAQEAKRQRAAILDAAVMGRLLDHRTEETTASHSLVEDIRSERRLHWPDRAKGPYRDAIEPNQDTLPRLPDGWGWTTLDALTVWGPQNGLYLPASRYGPGIAILRIDDYQRGGQPPSVERMRTVMATADQLETYQLHLDDLVINRVNSITHLGKTLVVSESTLPAVFESNMMRIRLSARARPRYVHLYLSSIRGTGLLIKNAKHAVNQASINQTDVLRTPIPLPPLSEQDRIIAAVTEHMSDMDRLVESIQASLTKADRLRGSVLAAAFSGRLVRRSFVEGSASHLLQAITRASESFHGGRPATPIGPVVSSEGLPLEWS